MASDQWDDDYEADELSGSDLVKKLRNELKRTAKERDEAKEAAQSLQKKVRQTEVKSILEEAGVNPKVARWVLNDVEDVTKENVLQWVDENGELFGISQVTPSEGSATAAAPKGMTVEEATALAQMNQFATPDPASGVNSEIADLEQKITSTKNPEELIELLKLNRAQAF